VQEHESDVLVIGSGGAGLRAAIAAAKTASVTVVSKGPLGRSGATVLSGADIMADGASLARLGYPNKPDDSPEAWARDILVEGFYINDENLVDAYAGGAGERVRELLEWGMTVRSTEERAVITTGVSICSALRRGLQEQGDAAVTRVDGVMIIDLLINHGSVVGAVGVDFDSGKILLFRAKTVVLATGGCHQAYRFNAGADELTGDGQGMAYRAGAELVDMEMVTFAPNILLAPPRYRGSLWFYILPGVLLNKNGDAFMNWENPKVAKLALTSEWNKLLFSKASMREVREGRGGPLGGVFFSMKHLPENLFDTLAEAYPGWRFQGDDFSELMVKMRTGYAAEVGPAAEYFEGGIRINERCETSIPGLYAAGECSGGLFGANRVAAATTEMVVEGEIAGREAARASKELDLFSIDEAALSRLIEAQTQLFERKGGEPVFDLRRRLRNIAYDKVGVIRDGRGLTAAVKELEEIEERVQSLSLTTKRRDHNREWMEAVELVNMVQCVHLTARAALERTESRGVHMRDDYPIVDNLIWRRHLIAKRGRDGVGLTPISVVSDKSPPLKTTPYEEAIVEAAEVLAHRRGVER